MEFNDFYWHDSVIENINIDRSDAGNIDTIAIRIHWYDTGFSTLLFEDVRWARLTMNFGIVAKESILNAYITSEDDADLIKVINMWKPFVDLNVNCYVINTNSTNSEIKIIAESFRIIYQASE